MGSEAPAALTLPAEPPPSTAERLNWAYGVVLPTLVDAYRELAAGAEGPLARVLRLVLADDEPALSEGAALVERLDVRAAKT